ncbi:MAG: DUF1127 domain-containing protein [Pseudomonadota bacterium]|nr:DUF1127 domain-containing protein [Pseudomonadota bacterium]
MKYYANAIDDPERTGAAAAPSLVARLFRNWKSRRRLARLGDLEDRLLEDIGLTPDELNWALSVPLTVNPAGELERSALRRRLEEARRRPGRGAY